jgi:hypothetical protein
MHDKAKLGDRYACYECGTKFYDLNRPTPTCPECSSNQDDAPKRDIKSLLSSGRRAKIKADEAADKAAAAAPVKSDEYDQDAEEAQEEEDEIEELDELAAPES